MQFLAPISVLVLALASTSAALGINCRGNSNCGGTLCSLHDLVGKASSIPDGNSFSPGQHIVCCTSPGPAPPGSGLCAFTQNTGSSISGADVKRHLQNLVNHGCGKCGSDPFQNNDVSQGQLTVNWVSNR